MRTRWIRAGLLLPLIPVIPALMAGTAHLASNTVPVTYADQVRSPVEVATTLVASGNATINVSQADNKGFYRFTGAVARLSVDGIRIAGEPVDITAAGGLICTAVTDARGRAVCPGDTKVDTTQFTSVPTSFTATFAGDGALQASSDTASLTSIG